MNTINYAIKSDLTLANFFTVVPQPKTPLYPLAEKENKEALEYITELNEMGGGSYRSVGSWYEKAHGFPLDRVLRMTIFRFYLSPPRLWRILRRVPKRMLWRAFLIWFKMVFAKSNSSESLVAKAEK